MLEHGIFAQNRFLLLLLLLLSYFITKAFIADSHLEYIVSLLFMLMVAFCLYAIGHSRQFIIIVSFLFGILFLGMVLSGGVLRFDRNLIMLEIILGIIFFFLITVASLTYTLQSERIRVSNLYGAFCTYLLLGLAWSYLYLLIDLIDPEAFNYGMTAIDLNVSTQFFIYYSFTTLTTLGYGDVVPISDAARTFSWIEACTGQIYLTVLIAQLVGLYIANRQNKQEKAL